MGGCPSTEEAPCFVDGTIASSRRELWTSALQIGGGCNHKLLEELLLGERRFVADMHVRKAPAVREERYRALITHDLRIESIKLRCGVTYDR